MQNTLHNMTYIIPNQNTKSLKQTNLNDISGSLFVTKNIDLREKGFIKLSHPAVAIYTTDNNASFYTADVLLKSDYLWAISTKPFRGITNALEELTDRSGDTNYPVAGTDQDGIYFNAVDVISSSTGIKYRSGATAWTTVGLSLSTSFPTKLEVFNKFACLLVGNNNTVQMINTSWVSFRTLTLPVQYSITSIAVNDSVVYIGTRHKTNGEAKLFVWDGETTAYNNEFGVDTFEISSVKKYAGSCALITSLGYLLQFNGGGFTELARLPLQNRNWGDAATPQLKVSNRGMVVEKEKIYIRLDSTNQGNIAKFNSYFPSGLWCYDPDNGLYCLATNSYSRVQYETIATTAVNTTTNVITVSSAPLTGTPVFYDTSNSTTIAGLSMNTIYYVINVSGTTIKLATSLANAQAGTAIDITSNGNNAQKLYFILVKDYGHTFTDNRGAVEIVSNSIISKDSYADKIVFAGRLYEPGKGVLNVLSPLVPNRGYFITPKLNSPADEENYNSVSLKFRPLKTGESIVVKYKTIDKEGVPFHSFRETTYVTGKYGTWVTTSQFTTTLDMTNAAVGDEIEVIAGVGAGFTAHITALTNNSGTWTVDLDEAFIFAVASNTMYFSCDNFQKLLEVTSTNQTSENKTEISLNKNSKFAQFKVELRGVDVAIEEFKVNNQKFKG